MPTRFVRDFSAIAGVAPEGSRVAVPATVAAPIRLALSTGSPVITPELPSLPALPVSELLPVLPGPALTAPLPATLDAARTTSMIQLGSSSMFVPGDFSGGLPASNGGQGSAIIDLIGKGIGLAGSILARNSPAAAQAPVLAPNIGRGGQVVAPGSALEQQTLQLLGIPRSQGHDTVLTKEGKPRKLRKDGRPYKRPTMNPLNPRALRRGMKRVQRFAKIASRTISFTKRVRMKKRRR